MVPELDRNALARWLEQIQQLVQTSQSMRREIEGARLGVEIPAENALVGRPTGIPF
jgi:hypothetical protein